MIVNNDMRSEQTRRKLSACYRAWRIASKLSKNGDFGKIWNDLCWSWDIYEHDIRLAVLRSYHPDCFLTRSHEIVSISLIGETSYMNYQYLLSQLSGAIRARDRARANRLKVGIAKIEQIWRDRINS